MAESNKSVGVISKPGIQNGPALLATMLAWFAERSITVRYDEQTAAYLGRTDGLTGRSCPTASNSSSCWAAMGRFCRPPAPSAGGTFRCWP
jgi:hypothetical protein